MTVEKKKGFVSNEVKGVSKYGEKIFEDIKDDSIMDKEPINITKEVTTMKVESNTSNNIPNNLPITIVKDLPSRFLPYPKGSVVKYIPYTFGDIKKVSQSKNLSGREQFELTLNGIFTEGFDRYDLTFSDYLFLGLLRRISVMGDSDMGINYYCGGCGQLNKNSIKTSEIDIKYLGAPELPVKIKLTGLELEFFFYPMTIKDFLKLDELSKLSDIIYIISTLCKKVKRNDVIEDANIDEIYEIISNITNPDDMMLLEEVDSVLGHTIEPIKFKCKNVIFNEECGFENLIEIDGGDVFITPFRNDRESIKSRICYGS